VPRVDFLLPGENIPFKIGNGTSQSYKSGSYVATAVASGLAGLLLFCNNLVEPNDEPYFKNNINIEKAFSTMSIGRLPKFPAVQSFFEHKFRLLLMPNEPKESRNDLSSLVDKELVWSEESKKALSSLMEIIKEGPRNYY